MSTESSALDCQPLASIAACQIIVNNLIDIVNNGGSLTEQKIRLNNLKTILTKASAFVGVVNVSLNDPLLQSIE